MNRDPLRQKNSQFRQVLYYTIINERSHKATSDR